MGRPYAVLALSLVATVIASASGCTCSRSSAIGEPSPSSASASAAATAPPSGRPLPSGIPGLRADAPLDIPSTLDPATLPMECKSWLAQTRQCIAKVEPPVGVAIRSAAITQLDAFAYQSKKSGSSRRLIGACSSALTQLVADHPECDFLHGAPLPPSTVQPVPSNAHPH